MPNIFSFFNLFMFVVTVSSNGAGLVDPPDFGDLSDNTTCPWTVLDYLGIAMLGCLGTVVLLAFVWCQRKLKCWYDAR